MNNILKAWPKMVKADKHFHQGDEEELLPLDAWFVWAAKVHLKKEITAISVPLLSKEDALRIVNRHDATGIWGTEMKKAINSQ